MPSTDIRTTSHPQAERAAARFRDAVSAVVGVAADRAERPALLQCSVRALLDAFLAARGRHASSDRERLQSIVDTPLLGPGPDDTLRRLLTIDTASRSTAADRASLAELERDYRLLLPALRSRLAAELPAQRGPGAVLTDLTTHRGARLIGAFIVAAGAILATAYQVLEPVYQLDMGAQVFWTGSPEAPFAEPRSKAFTVRTDGVMHHYSVPLDALARVAALRIDPVDSADTTEVEIRSVELLGPSGRPELIFSFDDRAAWSCHNCRSLPVADSGFRLRPLNDDPFIVGPPVDPVDVGGIRVAMRAVARKSFFEWLTRLEKTRP